MKRLEIKKIMKSFIGVVIICAIINYSIASASSDDKSSMPLFPGVTYASIATESEKPTSEAPAVISVITAEELHNHGITSLEQALEEIPGVYSPFRFLNGNFVFRGTRPQLVTNPEVLLLVDSIPQNDAFDGVLQRYITRIPIGNIKRIEVIRGAGSSLYGADAFSGVINIITKTNDDYEKAEIRGRAGSYDTFELDGILKGQLGSTKTLFSLQGRTTSGHEPSVREDAQTFFDGIYGTNASLAPGDANTYFEEVNASLEFFAKRWRVRFQLRDHSLGMGISFLNALTSTGYGRSTQKNLDVFYQNPDLSKSWLFKTRFNYMEDEVIGNKPLFPPGAFNGSFPDGVNVKWGGTERQTRFETRLINQNDSQHEIVFGLGLINIEFVDIIDTRNVEFLPGGVLSPLGSYFEQPVDKRYLQDVSRQIRYLMVQDDWNIMQDLIVSVGARADDYSDINTVYNPRIAFIWLTRHDITTKLIANRAFRAPTFLELYAKNFLQNGNTELDPSVINTLEIVIEKRFFSNANINVSIYSQKITDMIETVQSVNSTIETINSGDTIMGNGIEIETSIPLRENIEIKSSYSYQKNEREGNTIYNASPHHKIYTGVDWKFKQNWNLYTNILWLNDFTRDVSDPRDDLGSSAFVGTVLRYTSPTKRLESYLSIRNIFDEKAVSTSDDYRFLPNDIPLPGTNYIIEFRYRM